MGDRCSKLGTWRTLHRLRAAQQAPEEQLLLVAPLEQASSRQLSLSESASAFFTV